MFVANEDEGWTVLVDAALDRGLDGKVRDGPVFSIDVCLPYRTFKASHVEIRHFYGLRDLEYKGLRQYLFRGMSGYDYVRLRCAHVWQSFYNRRPIVRLELMDLLGRFVEFTSADTKFKSSPGFLVAHLHGTGALLHPDHEHVARYYKLLMDALVQSGDLRFDGFGYAVTPQALVTVARFEREERRHRDSLRSSVAMRRLTIALVLVGLIQAYVTWLGVRCE